MKKQAMSWRPLHRRSFPGTTLERDAGLDKKKDARVTKYGHKFCRNAVISEEA